MENTYNVRISFKGEGNFQFTLPGYGELTIYSGRDIFVKDLSVSGVEMLRQLRPLMLEHKLNAKPDGCYKVIDLSKTTRPMFIAPKVEEAKSVAQLKAEMIKTSGPIVEEPIEKNTVITFDTIEEIKEAKENKVESKVVATKRPTNKKRNSKKK